MVGPHEVEVALAEGGTATLKAKNIMLATGSEVTPLPGVPIDEEKWVRGDSPWWWGGGGPSNTGGGAHQPRRPRPACSCCRRS